MSGTHWRACRFCGEGTAGEMVKYGVRHYAHFACYLDAGRPLAALSPWQVGQFPWRVLRERGLSDEAERMLDAAGDRTKMLFNPDMRRAVLAARERLGDTDASHVSTSIAKGRTNVVRVTYARRRTTVETLAAGLTDGEAVEYLDALGRGGNAT